jgi:hypothetical protein
MTAAAVLVLLVLASAGLSLLSWRKLRELEERAAGRVSFRTSRVALFSVLPVLLTGALLTWRHALSGADALEFFIAYAAVAYPLLLWIGYVLMRIARGSE